MNVKIPVILGIVLVLIIIASTLLKLFSQEIPMEYLNSITVIIAFLIGLITHNPLNGKE